MYFLPWTSTVAISDEVFPRMLIATHRYSPLSVFFAFFILKDLLSEPNLTLESPLLLIRRPLLFHDIEGTGLPTASHDKVKLLYSDFVTFCG